MKKIVAAIATTFLMTTVVMAQEDRPSTQRPPKRDKTEMVRQRTDDMVKRYKLSDKQAKQLLELNTRHADKMRPPRGHRQQRPPVRPDSIRGQHPHGQGMPADMKAYETELQKIMTAEQFKAYKADMQRHRPSRGQRPPREPK